MSLRRIVSRVKATISGSDVDAYYTSYVVPRVKHIETGDYYECTLDGSTGRYVCDTPDGHLVFFDDTTEQPNVLGAESEGGTWFGDDTLPYLPLDTSGGLWDSHWDAQGQTIENIRDIDSSSENSHALNLGSANEAFIQRDPTADQTITGFAVHFEKCPITDTDAVLDEEIPNYKQVQDLIVTTAPQQSDRVRRIIAGGVVVAGSIYRDCNTAISAISDNAIDKQYQLLLEEGTSVSAVTDNVFYASHANLKNYVHIKGNGINTRLVLGTTGTSTSKTITLENMTVYMGVNDITAARLYQYFTFRNCWLRVWNDITFSSCYLDNVKLYQPSGKGFTFAGACEIDKLTATNAMISDSGTGLRNLITDSWNTSYSMGTDISLAP